MYPELEIFEFLLTAFVAIVVALNLLFAGVNIFFHTISLLWATPESKFLILTNAAQSSSYSIPHNFIDFIGITGWTLHIYILARLSSNIVSAFRRSIPRLAKIPSISYSIIRLRRVIAHLIIGQLAFLVGVYAIFGVLLLGKLHFEVSLTALTGAGLFFAFVFGFTLLMAFSYSRTSQNIIEKFFEVVGGYSDGEIGRKLHKQRKSVEEALSDEQLQEIEFTGKD